MATNTSPEEQGFNTFVDKMSGGIPALGAFTVKRDYAVIGEHSNLLPIDELTFMTSVQADSFAPSGPRYARSLTLGCANIVVAEVFSSLQCGIELQLGVSDFRLIELEDEVSPLTQLTRHIIKTAISLRDSGHLQELNVAS
jgi:hypothetical protein